MLPYIFFTEYQTNVFYITLIIIRKILFSAEQYIAAFHNKALSVFNVCLYDFLYNGGKEIELTYHIFSQINPYSFFPIRA